MTDPVREQLNLYDECVTILILYSLKVISLQGEDSLDCWQQNSYADLWQVFCTTFSIIPMAMKQTENYPPAGIHYFSVSSPEYKMQQANYTVVVCD